MPDDVVKQRMKPILVLKKFFELKLDQKLRGFLEEVKKLSEDEKLELARLAAVELGIELDESPAT